MKTLTPVDKVRQRLGTEAVLLAITVACALVNGFALDADTALRHLSAYNAKCSPPWSARELRHKVQQAEKTAHTRPRGHLLGASAQQPAEAVQSVPKAVPVCLEPKENRFRTSRTTIFNPYGHTREKELPHTHRSVGAFHPSEASETGKGVVRLPTPDTSIGIPITSPSNGLTDADREEIKAEFPPSDADEAWRAVEAAGFGDEPLIALAFDLFGPGCCVISTGESATV